MWDQLRKKGPTVNKGPVVAPTKVAIPNSDDTIEKLDAALAAVDEEERKKKEIEEKQAKEREDSRYNRWSSCRC